MGNKEVYEHGSGGIGIDAPSRPLQPRHYFAGVARKGRAGRSYPDRPTELLPKVRKILDSTLRLATARLASGTCPAELGNVDSVGITSATVAEGTSGGDSVDETQSVSIRKSYEEYIWNASIIQVQRLLEVAKFAAKPFAHLA